VVIPAYAIADSHQSSKNKLQTKKIAEANKRYIPMMQNDPALGLKERWDLVKDLQSNVFSRIHVVGIRFS